MIDSGKYSESWQESAEYVKALVNKENWQKRLQGARQPLGKMLSRKLKSQRYMKEFDMLFCNCRNALRLPAVIVGISVFCSLARAEFPKFEYHQIARIGDKMGRTSLVDVDKDGDLDWIAGCNGGTIWWFEYKGPDNWVRHTLGQKVLTEVGGTAFDVDGDIDICSKPWNGNEHIYLRNMLKERRGN